jgi:hypothetical protein
MWQGYKILKQLFGILVVLLLGGHLDKSGNNNKLKKTGRD